MNDVPLYGHIAILSSLDAHGGISAGLPGPGHRAVMVDSQSAPTRSRLAAFSSLCARTVVEHEVQCVNTPSPTVPRSGVCKLWLFRDFCSPRILFYIWHLEDSVLFFNIRRLHKVIVTLVDSLIFYSQPCKLFVFFGAFSNFSCINCTRSSQAGVAVGTTENASYKDRWPGPVPRPRSRQAGWAPGICICSCTPCGV